MRSHNDYPQHWYGKILIACGLHALCIVVALSSCNTGKRLSKIHAHHPVMVADSCVVWFPVKSDTVVYTVLKDGRIDTVYGEQVFINCDSIVMAALDGASKTVSHHVPCPPAQIITKHDTLLKQEIIHVEDSAKLMGIRDELRKSRYEATKYKGQSASRLKWAIYEGVLLFLIVSGFVLHLYVKNKSKVIDGLEKMKGV